MNNCTHRAIVPTVMPKTGMFFFWNNPPDALAFKAELLTLRAGLPSGEKASTLSAMNRTLTTIKNIIEGDILVISRYY